MNAKELRIGNYVEILGEVDEIKGINKNEHGGYVNFLKTYNNYYLIHNDEELVKPIKLTEDWLLKFGFENSYRSDFTFTMQHMTNDKFGIKINVSTGMSLVYLGIPIRIEYVHQLQNLYFSLTGEELELKTESK